MRKQAFSETEPIQVGESMQLIATSLYRLLQEAFGKRDAEIFWQHDTGQKTFQIAKTHGLTSNRVRQITADVSRYIDKCFCERRLRLLTIIVKLQSKPEEMQHILLTAGYEWDSSKSNVRETTKKLDLEQRPFKTELDTLNLNTRTKTALTNRRITTVEDLCNMSRRDLNITRGIGPTTMKHIEQQMNAHNLHFKD